MTHVTALVLAAGEGVRFKSRIPKPLVKINSKPLIIHSLLTLCGHQAIRDIIVVVNPGNQQRIVKSIKLFNIKKVIAVVQGGRRRQDSVCQGLKALDRHTDLVLIHDAARPFIDRRGISSAISEAGKTGAAILGVPVKDTIKEVFSSKIVKRTLKRKDLWQIQTPQVFKKDIILKAYKRFAKTDVTDDASLVEKLGIKVSVLPGSYRNIKITTVEDLALAEAILR